MYQTRLTLLQDPTTGRVSTTTDLWSVDQTKLSFMGITAHWIEVNNESGKWELMSEVIAFRTVFGPHDGSNLGRYFIGLCERAGIITKTDCKVCHPNIARLGLALIVIYLSPQLFCITADNTSNNDTACDHIETILNHRHIYSFDPFQHRLPCLAHVLNLAIVDVMSEVTRIGHIATSTAIWEFDPSLPSNRVMNHGLDVVAIVRTLAIKIQASGQRIAYFQRLQKECNVSTPLVIPLQNNTRWGTADGMLGRSYELRQVRFYLLSISIDQTDSQPQFVLGNQSLY